jgi:hypothetical protein
METFVESVRLSGSVALQASPRKFRLHRSYLWEFAPFDESLPAIGDVNVTRQTMAGAIFAGLPPKSSGERGGDESRSLLSYIYDLAMAYHTTHSTPPTMRRAAERLAAKGQHGAAKFCLRVAEEESGDDLLALQDLAALGVPAEPYVQRVRPQDAAVVIDLFARLTKSDEPVAVLGFVYALERLALLNTAESIGAIERLIPPGVMATRCVRAHSAIGREVEHLAGLLEFIATLPARDRATVARAGYETTHVFYAAPTDYPSERDMSLLLRELGTTSAWLDDACARLGAQ